MTQLKQARLNKITPEMKLVAQLEDCDAETLRSNIAEGKVVIPRNKKHTLKKIRAAEEAQADAVMDLSTGGDLRAIRRKIMENCSITIGSVPIYEAAVDAVKHKHSVIDMTAKSMLDAIKRHYEDGG